MLADGVDVAPVTGVVGDKFGVGLALEDWAEAGAGVAVGTAILYTRDEQPDKTKVTAKNR